MGDKASIKKNAKNSFRISKKGMNDNKENNDENNDKRLTEINTQEMQLRISKPLLYCKENSLTSICLYIYISCIIIIIIKINKQVLKLQYLSI